MQKSRDSGGGKGAGFDISNPYVWRARLQPAMIVALPVGLAVLAWSPGGVAGWGVVWSFFVFCGGTALMAQVARDRGKTREFWLFKRWGGKPTTRLLRHRDSRNMVLLSRRHARLQELVAGVQIPTAKQEEKNPAKADQVYDSCTAFLLEKTRDKKQFPLVFEENCNYGFRRNLWGMKPLGILTSAAGTAAVAVLVTLAHRNHSTPALSAIICGIINSLLLMGWIAWFTPEWVRIPAEAFAERLIAACEVL